MKNMFKFVCGSVLTIVLFTGCISTQFSPETQGVVTGKLLYTTYVKVAKTQDAEFSIKVEKLWSLVNSIQSTDDLNVKYEELNKQFTDILQSKGLDDVDVVILSSVANDVLSKVKSVVTDNFTMDSTGIQFLLGVRTGVNSMIDATNKINK